MQDLQLVVELHRVRGPIRQWKAPRLPNSCSSYLMTTMCLNVFRSEIDVMAWLRYLPKVRQVLGEDSPWALRCELVLEALRQRCDAAGLRLPESYDLQTFAFLCEVSRSVFCPSFLQDAKDSPNSGWTTHVLPLELGVQKTDAQVILVSFKGCVYENRGAAGLLVVVAATICTVCIPTSLIPHELKQTAQSRLGGTPRLSVGGFESPQLVLLLLGSRLVAASVNCACAGALSN